MERLPSVDTLALLTAIMGKGAQAAIQHWRDCEWELEVERAFPEGIGGRVSLAETMERLGIRAEPTMKKLLRAHFPRMGNADFETRWAERRKFDAELIEALRRTQRDRNAERGRTNRASAMKKRGRKKPSK